jgi:hypothetical protein
MKLTHIDETKAPRSHSIQIDSVDKFEYVKVALRDPRNTTAAETRMRYEVTKCPGSNSRSCSVERYSGRGIDKFAARYHTRSTQSSLNSHERYLGMSLRVSYDPRRKRLHKVSGEHFHRVPFVDSHKKDHNARYPF